MASKKICFFYEESIIIEYYSKQVLMVMSFLRWQKNAKTLSVITQASVFPTPLVPGRGTHSLGGRGGGGVPIRTRDRHCGTLGICVLCGEGCNLHLLDFSIQVIEEGRAASKSHH